MIKSKTQIKKQVLKKTNPELVETINLARKHKEWIIISGILAGPRRLYSKINLDKIEKETKEGDTIIIPGKVLGQGEIEKKIRVAALDFSEQALEKLKSKKCEIISIKEEIEKNEKAQGVKILR